MTPNEGVGSFIIDMPHALDGPCTREAGLRRQLCPSIGPRGGHRRLEEEVQKFDDMPSVDPAMRRSASVGLACGVVGVLAEPSLSKVIVLMLLPFSQDEAVDGSSARTIHLPDTRQKGSRPSE
jgi:hypothetical protein